MNFPFLKQVAGRRPSRRRGEDGVTLVELLVVLVILALLAGLVGPQVINYLGGAKSKTARLQIESLGAALDLYRLDVGSYPTEEQGLQALVDQPPGVEGWNGSYLKKEGLPLDPWNVPYIYRNPGQHGSYDLFSLGADKREGGDGEDADVTSW